MAWKEYADGSQETRMASGARGVALRPKLIADGWSTLALWGLVAAATFVTGLYAYWVRELSPVFTEEPVLVFFPALLLAGWVTVAWLGWRLWAFSTVSVKVSRQPVRPGEEFEISIATPQRTPLTVSLVRWEQVASRRDEKWQESRVALVEGEWDPEGSWHGSTHLPLDAKPVHRFGPYSSGWGLRLRGKVYTPLGFNELYVLDVITP